MDASRNTLKRAKRQRRRPTYTEAKLWTCVRRNALEGLHFRRQHPFGRFVLDFYCDAARLAVEVDGGIHNLPEKQAVDALRDAWLGERGIRVLRLPAEWVVSKPNEVRRLILEAAALQVRRTATRTVSV
jgi:very-short-patch-repair endonuclease